MSLTGPQQDELEKPSPKVVYFMEMQFASSTQRLSTWNRNFTWGGNTWIGLGGLINISSIVESEGLSSKALSFGLNAADPAWIALAVGPDTEYRHKLVLLYMCPISNLNQLIDTPVLCWRGRMDSVAIAINGNESTISLKCETAAYAFKRRPTLRINAEQQKKVYPTDTGFDYLRDLLAKPQLWLSKKFQAG